MTKKLATEDPSLFFETYKPPILINESQKVPSIFVKIKDIVNKHSYEGKDCNGYFWLTGSKRLYRYNFICLLEKRIPLKTRILSILSKIFIFTCSSSSYSIRFSLKHTQQIAFVLEHTLRYP